MDLYGSMRRYSYKHSLCYSLDEFMEMVNGYLKEV